MMKQNHVEEKEKMKKDLAPISLIKVGYYCEGEGSNITIPIACRGVMTLAILDSGAGVAIATKGIRESGEDRCLEQQGGNCI